MYVSMYVYIFNNYSLDARRHFIHPYFGAHLHSCIACPNAMSSSAAPEMSSNPAFSCSTRRTWLRLPGARRSSKSSRRPGYSPWPPRPLRRPLTAPAHTPSLTPRRSSRPRTPRRRSSPATRRKTARDQRSARYAWKVFLYEPLTYSKKYALI